MGTNVVLDITLVSDLDLGLSSLGGHLERPVLHVLLNIRLFESSSDQSLSIKHSLLKKKEKKRIIR